MLYCITECVFHPNVYSETIVYTQYSYMYIHTMTFSFNMTHIKQTTCELNITPVQMHMKVEIWTPSQVTAISEILLWTCTLKVVKNSHPQLYIHVFLAAFFVQQVWFFKSIDYYRVLQ